MYFYIYIFFFKFVVNHGGQAQEGVLCEEFIACSRAVCVEVSLTSEGSTYVIGLSTSLTVKGHFALCPGTLKPCLSSPGTM